MLQSLLQNRSGAARGLSRMEGGGRGRDHAWAAFAVVMLVLLVGAVFDALWRVVFDGDWLRLLVLPVAVLFYWWWGMGAWRRTIWGRRRTLRRRLSALTE